MSTRIRLWCICPLWEACSCGGEASLRFCWLERRPWVVDDEGSFAIADESLEPTAPAETP